MYEKYLASFLLILVGVWQTITAQNISKSKFKHQFDIGLNNGFFFGNSSGFNGLGSVAFPQVDFSNDIWRKNKEGEEYKILNILFDYKLIFNEKHYFKIAKNTFSSSPNIYFKDEGTIGFHADIYSLGYGYNILNKKINFTIFGQICNRKGVEAAHINVDGLQGYLPSTLDYNSIGIATGSDLSYFFTKNFAIGTDFYFYYFPIETNKIGVKGYPNIDPVIFKNYKPIDYFMFISLKLAYKFGFN